MNKTLYILLLTFLIFMVGCSKDQDIENKISEGRNSSEKNLLVGSGIDISYDEFLSKIKTEYKKDPQFNSCMKNNIQMCYNSTITQLAQKKQDIDICDELQDSHISEACKQGIVSAKAMKSGDIKECDALKDSNKYNCQVQVYRDLASKKQDIGLCDKIPEPSTGTGQIVMFNPKNSCINDISLQLAMGKRDVSFCKKITEDMMKKHCEDMVRQMGKNDTLTGSISQ